MKSRIIKKTLFLINLFISLSSKFVFAEDLHDLYMSALKNDAQLAAEQARFFADSEQSNQRYAQLLPQLSAEAQSRWSDNRYEATTNDTRIKQVNQAYSLQLIQPLFRWQNWVRYKQAEQIELLASGRLASARQSLLLRISEAYFEALHADDVYNAVKQLHTAEAEQLAIAKKNFELGNVSIADIHEAQASLDKTSADLVDANSSQKQAYYNISRMIGYIPSSLASLRDDVILSPPTPDDINVWIAAATKDNLEVQIREYQYSIAQYEVSSRKAEHLPTLDAVANWSTQSSPNLSIDQSETTSIGLRMSIPLYAGGGVSAAVRSAAASKAQSEAELDDAIRGAVVSTNQAWLGLIGGLARIRALEASKISAQSALDSNRIGYRVGVRSNIDVLEAQSRYSEIIQQLSRAKYNTVLSYIRLKLAAGRLRERDLDEINSLLIKNSPTTKSSLISLRVTH